jgi:hypothetical protein
MFFATLNYLIYVLNLTKNIFPMSKATSQGYNVEFGDDTYEIKNS